MTDFRKLAREAFMMLMMVPLAAVVVGLVAWAIRNDQIIR